MGKLNIAHHKSYHPYRRDNIERVRQDEEEARIKEAQEEGRIMLADAEARIAVLRQRAGVDKRTSKRQEEKEEERKLLEAAGTGRRDYLDMTSSTAQLPTTGGHINFFQDVEKNELATTIKTTTAKQVASSSSLSTDKGIALAPSEKDLNPWYSNRRKEGEEEVDGDKKEDDNGKRLREIARKSVYDPLTSINHRLALNSNSANDNHHQDRFKHPRLPPSRHSTANVSDSRPQYTTPDPQATRLARESSERERALALIRRKKREMMGSETPSTVHGGVDEGYGDMFNREEVAEARKERERDRHVERYWDDGRDRDRSWNGVHGRGGREDERRRSSWSSSATKRW
ncbi:hypothetical protein M378DRAFT_130349 [Amanita muscaria Koide BX008]|uniref:CBF1-interacting co-repressor CIR N-terminal domain-containing protein n=1 Tax=Amanita muscaria (strain Koide BX008) TaxID=946122 RepID=A0A0C2WH27_AMAMK|nr:hypothetical protein M378DRAFT_130349 [Amanita muscaria Koide BX008]